MAIHIAEITDPTTGEQVTLTAGTAEELDQLVEKALRDSYPLDADWV